MAKKEKHTDYWVYDMLKEANIDLDPQGSEIKELKDALKTASKAGTGKAGYPEYCGVVKDFVLVIENKADISKHLKRNKDDVICDKVENVKNYAVNGALFYGKHLAKKTFYKKIIAFGVSGNEKRHRITPVFIDERGAYKELEDVETFALFNEKSIDEYYTRSILKEETPEEKTTEEILKDAKTLHEDLRKYGSVQDTHKPLIVSGILLALREMEHKGFSIESLIGDETDTDGEKIYKAIEANLKRADVSPQVKKDKLLTQFSIIKDNKTINELDKGLEKTPLRYYTEFLHENIYKNIKYINSSEDYIGRFYGEFMSYSGGDGQSLGIILTPKHITDLFCDLVGLKYTSSVLDPCCGTGGFLISAMHNMLQKTNKPQEQENIRKNQLHGLELQPYMFTIATTNMILRGDGKSNLEQEDFLRYNASQLQKKGCTVGMMNPPYSMGGKDNPRSYEINFTEHLLDSIVKGGKVVVIVPQSSMTGKTIEEKATKANILKHHTLEGVITLNKNTFYGVGTNACIAVFTAGISHDKDKKVKFINFEKDGFEVKVQHGQVETAVAKDKKQYLLDVWFNRIEAQTKFCVKTTIEDEDEWSHSFYYYNDEIPKEEDFENTMADYLTFEFNMIVQGNGYLFKNNEKFGNLKSIEPFKEKKWKEFLICEEFAVENSTAYHKTNLKEVVEDGISYVTRTNLNNGLKAIVKKQDFKINKPNTVAFGAENATFFYQPNEYITGNKMYYIQHERLNRYSGLFLQTTLNKSIEDCNFGYGKGLTGSRAKNRYVLLPINGKNQPDFDYMENYMKQLEKEKMSKYMEKKRLYER